MSQKAEQIDKLIYDFEIGLNIDKKGKVRYEELFRKITDLRIQTAKILNCK